MNTEPVDKSTHCTRCRTALVFDTERSCSYCPRCNPPQKKAVKVKEKERRYVDVRMTEKRVREIIEEMVDELVPDMIREELENWHIRKPPVTREDVKELTLGEQHVQEILTEQRKNESTELTQDEKVEDRMQKGQHVNWRSMAKELGIPLSQPTGGARKKVDVIKDIEKELSAVGSSD